MKKTISFFTKGKALCFVLLSGAFFLLGMNDAAAQENAQGNLNPFTHIATKLDVTAYPLGTFERTHSVQVLEQIIVNMKNIFSNGGGTSAQRLKYSYVNKLLGDINTDYVAVEISLLTSLSELTADTNTTGTQNSQLKSLYIEIVNQLQ